MIKPIIAFYNVTGGFFRDPMFIVGSEKDFCDSFIQNLCYAKLDYLEAIQDCDLYCLGSYDNTTGELISKKEFMVHVSEYAAKYIEVLKFKSKSLEVKSDE